jgi:hypothetical protein
MRNFVMAESFMFLVYHEFRILFAASDTARRKVQTRVLQVQRMSGMTGRDAASEVIDERQDWAESRPANPSSFGSKPQNVTLI